MTRRPLSAAFRVIAAIGALLTCAFTFWSIGTVFAATTSAPFTWRLQSALADAWIPCCLTIGFALATTTRARLRQIGWGVVLLTILVATLWGFDVITHAHAPRTVTVFTTSPATHTALHTTLRLALAIGATAAILDQTTRAQRIATAYDLHSKDLFAYALSLCARNTAAAEDLVHDLFCALGEDKKHDGALQRGEPLKGYLITTLGLLAKSTARADRRREQREADFVELSPSATPAADREYEDTELGIRLDTAVNELPPRVAEAFRLVHIFGYRCVEAAKLMGVSDSTVRGYVKVALETLYPKFLDVATASSRLVRPETA